jgi:arylsulfatase A-like enzyme
MYRRDSLPIGGSQKDISRVRQKIRLYNNPNIPEVRALESLYGGEISYLDEHLGRLFDSLRERGILDRSLLIITGDHGETFAEHPELFQHGMEVYDTTITPPLIIRFPDGAGRGRRPSGLVSNVDVMPTILEWLGFEGPERMEGRSFAAIREQELLPDRGPVFCEATKPWSDRYESDPKWRNQRKMKCVRVGKWKLIWRPLERDYELYDLQVDPGERVNLLAKGDPGLDAPVEAMKRQLYEWAAEANPLPSEKVDSVASKKMLKAMGYAGGGD